MPPDREVSGEEAVQKARHTVNIESADPELGMVMGGGSYVEGFLSQVMAIPFEGNEFVGCASQPGSVFTYTQTNLNRRHFMVNGTLTLENIILCGDEGLAHNRGGAEMRDGGHLIMNDGSVIRNNQASSGGGVHVTGAGIPDNPSFGSGGGIMLDSTAVFNMHGGEITGNTTPADIGMGGGVFMGNGARFNMHSGALIANNEAHYGGGVAVWVFTAAGNFIMHGGIIEGNTANDGGGIYWQNRVALGNITVGNNAAVYNNTADVTRVYDQLNLEHSGRINPGTITVDFEHAFNNDDIYTDGGIVQ